jgi:putative restriction endonuclease
MDDLIRPSAFNWLKDQIRIQGDVLPRELLATGFLFDNHRITLMGPSGIWKPQRMELPISITTTFDSPYDDSDERNGLIEYKYRGKDPYHRDNVGLREVMRLRKPLIYFNGMVKGRYFPAFPVYIIHDDPARLTFTVQVDEIKAINQPEMVEETDATRWRRAYATTIIKTRLHQRSFRERVLLAYQTQCAFCRLKYGELLDSAHIISDGEEKGDPMVSNGLSLCKIHHGAFDSNIIGITPDYSLHVREDILEEVDGPMLKYGLQSMHGNLLILPKHKIDFPDKERLEYRYEQFLKAG